MTYSEFKYRIGDHLTHIGWVFFGQKCDCRVGNRYYNRVAHWFDAVNARHGSGDLLVSPHGKEWPFAPWDVFTYRVGSVFCKIGTRLENDYLNEQIAAEGDF